MSNQKGMETNPFLFDLDITPTYSPTMSHPTQQPPNPSLPWGGLQGRSSERGASKVINSREIKSKNYTISFSSENSDSKISYNFLINGVVSPVFFRDNWSSFLTQKAGSFTN